MKILIVEDDRFFSAILEEALTLWGYRPEWVTTGNTALKRMREQPFDVVLLDIYLPDAPGYRFISEFKEINPKVHIVTMTGYNSRELEKEVRRQGISYYMIKPFNIDQLRDMIGHMNKKIRYEEEVWVDGDEE